MPTVASLQVEITGNTSNFEQASVRVNAQLDQLVRQAGGADASFAKMTSSVAVGTTIANAFAGAIGGIAGVLQNAAGATLNLASRLEQARIGFSTMLGGVQQADQFIGQLQQKAESTAFNFPGIQQVAQSFLAMGVAGSRVIPIIDDISNALSAAGHGGDTAMLQRVGQSLSEIQAAGKLSGEQIRELSRDGIAVLPLLAEAFGTTAGEVRKMAEAGEITADKFFAAFHSEVALHYGDIQAQQAKTWAVAASNVEDILGRLSTQTFKELTDAMTAGALAVNDFLHSERFTAWAGDVKQAVHEVMAALAPLGAAFQGVLGLSGQTAAPAAAAPKPIAPAPDIAAQSRDSWAQAGKSVADYKAKVIEADAEIHRITASINALSAQKLTLHWEIEDKKREFELRLVGLRDQQEALNLDIQKTRDHYAAILEPLGRMQTQLSRLGEDTKAAFSAIADPLKAQLDQVNRRIADAKSAYEAVVRPIQAQIDAIEKANQALHRQLTTQTQIADLALRSKILNAQGDPNARGDIAAKLLLNQYAQQDLDNQRQLAELTSKKGLSEKAAADFDKQSNVLKAEQVRLEQQGLGLIDRSAMAEAERQKVINDAAKERNAITLGNADLAAQGKEDPLKAQLAAAQAQLKAITDPLELQQASLTRAIQDVAAAETQAMAPIIKAQQDLARQIQDVNQAQQDALKPMEAQQKAIAAQIAATEAAQRAVLEPLQAQEQSLQRQIDLAEQDKKKWEEIKTAASDALKEIKAGADAAAKAMGADSAATNPVALPGQKVGGGDNNVPVLAHAQVIPQGTIQSINDFATSLTNLSTSVKKLTDVFVPLNTELDKLNARFSGGEGGGGSFLNSAPDEEKIARWQRFGEVAVIALTDTADWINTVGDVFSAFGTGMQLEVQALQKLMSGDVLGFMALDKQAGDAFNQIPGIIDGARVRAADRLKEFPAAVAAQQEPMQTAAADLGGAVPAGLNPQFDQAVIDAQLKAAGVPKAVTDQQATMLAEATTLGGNMPKGIGAGVEAEKMNTDQIVGGWILDFIKQWDPVKRLFEWFEQHWPGAHPPSVTLPGVPGTGTLQTSFNPGQGGGWSDIPPSMQNGGGGDLQGDVLLKYVLDKFTEALGSEGGKAAAAVALTEGGLYGARGDNNQSAGVFQFYGGPGGGQLNNFAAWLNTSLENAANIATTQPDVAVQFALQNYLGKTIQAGLAAGLTGPDLATYAQRYGQVSVSPERAGQSYNTLFGAGGTMPQTTVDLSGGVSGQNGGNRLMSFTPNQGAAVNPQVDQAAAAAAQARATAQAQLTQILQAGAPAQAAANAATGQSIAVQQQATDWARVFADQQARLSLVLGQSVPKGAISAQQSLAAMSSVIGPIERQVAGGAISANTLQFKLLDLARATGLNTSAWDAFNKGSVDSTAAMEMLIRSSAPLGPEFANIAKYLDTAGSSSTEAALRFLQAIIAYGKLTPVAGAATTAQTGLATATDAAASAIDPLAGDHGALVQTATQATKDMTTALDGANKSLGDVTGAAGSTADAIDKLDKAFNSLGDYLDKHTFEFKVNIPDIPDWAKPGSPTPFEIGLWGIHRALTSVNGIIAPSLEHLAASPLQVPNPRSALTARATSDDGRVSREDLAQITTHDDHRTVIFQGIDRSNAKEMLREHDRLELLRARNGRR